MSHPCIFGRSAFTSDHSDQLRIHSDITSPHFGLYSVHFGSLRPKLFHFETLRSTSPSSGSHSGSSHPKLFHFETLRSTSSHFGQLRFHFEITLTWLRPSILREVQFPIPRFNLPEVISERPCLDHCFQNNSYRSVRKAFIVSIGFCVSQIHFVDIVLGFLRVSYTS